jgi:hypothetical protein
VSFALLLAALPCLFWPSGVESAPALKSAGIQRLCVPPDQAEAWRAAGFSVLPLDESQRASRETLPAPGIRPRVDRASPTRSPWVWASGWRFLRVPAGTYSYELPAGKAALAAAEAFAYGADAVLKVDPSDVESLGRMQSFLATLPEQALPDLADVAVVDDGGAALAEVLNLLARRNLLFRIVKQPAGDLSLSVKLGTAEYPLREAADPGALALKIRRQVGDEQRVLRIFGSEIVLARVTADASRLRLHLLNYGGRELEGLRIRLRGSYSEGAAFVAGQGRVVLEEFARTDAGTEFTLPTLSSYAVIDLPALKAR